MIHLITNREKEYSREELGENSVVLAKITEFNKWVNFLPEHEMIQVDTETNVVRDLVGFKRVKKGAHKWSKPILDESGNKIPENRTCFVIQIGDESGEEQWIFDVGNGIDSEVFTSLKFLLEGPHKKILHNALFDYTVLALNFGIKLKNIRDTFLMSKVLTTGLEVGKDLPDKFNSLANCVSRYLGIELSKEAQTTFDGEPLSGKQVVYAALDVALLGKLHAKLQIDIDEEELENVVRLENAIIEPYGNSQLENLYFDEQEWRDVMNKRAAEAKDLLDSLYEIMKTEEFLAKCQDLGMVTKEPKYDFKWGSRGQKGILLRLVCPFVPADYTTLVSVRKFYNSLKKDNPKEYNLSFLKLYIDKDFAGMEKVLIENNNSDLIKMGLFTEAGFINMNFNSPDQTLKLFRIIKPSLNNTKKDSISKINHIMIKTYMKYKKASKLATSYGENFIDYVSPDGQLRVPGYTQVLSTGRSSMKLYQLLPGKGEYRKPFKANSPDGTRSDGKKWAISGADYSSQELCVLATFSGEEDMLNALRNGWDLHSINTQKLFPEEWSELGGDPEPKGKPSSKKLLKRRADTKATIFGICYGKSAIGLGESLDIPGTTRDLITLYSVDVEEFITKHSDLWEDFYLSFGNGKPTKKAKEEFIRNSHAIGLFLPGVVTGQDMINLVFDSFPKMAEFLHSSAEEGFENFKIATPDPFNRIRYFNRHVVGSEINEIKRASQNYKLQASSANMTKFAIVLMQKYINAHNLNHKVRFILPLHDEILFLVWEEFAEEWLDIQIRLMEEAGEMILNNKLQKAEGQISSFWVK